MVMKRRGGTKSKTIERMLNVFQSTTVMSVGYTVLLLSAKTRQENQRNEASRL